MTNMQAHDDDGDHSNANNSQAVFNLIKASKDLTAKMPLTAEMRPLHNPYCPEAVYRSAVITDLFATKPGEGVGGDWLQQIAQICDREDITLHTDAACDRSKAFYLSHGFERTQNARHMLVRWPPPTPELLAAMARDARA